jgi:hypothetical protein
MVKQITVIPVNNNSNEENIEQVEDIINIEENDIEGGEDIIKREDDETREREERITNEREERITNELPKLPEKSKKGKK